MGDKVKVSILERNGQELDFQEEQLLEASIVDYDDLNADQLTATDLKAAVDSLANREFGKDFQSSYIDTEISTTGGASVTHNSFNATTVIGKEYITFISFGWDLQVITKGIDIDVLIGGSSIFSEMYVDYKPGNISFCRKFTATAIATNISINFSRNQNKNVSIKQSCIDVWRVG